MKLLAQSLKHPVGLGYLTREMVMHRVAQPTPVPDELSRL